MHAHKKKHCLLSLFDSSESRANRVSAAVPGAKIVVSIPGIR